MRKATFTVQNATEFSTRHNSRLVSPDYLLDYTMDAYEFDIIHYPTEYVQLAKYKYKTTKKQKMQKKQLDALIKKTVLTVLEHHTLQDIKNLFIELNKKYGGHILTEVYLHKDEGYFEKDGIDFYRNHHIFQKSHGWYIIPLEKFLDDNYIANINDATEKIEITEYKKIYNYHVHAIFSMFDIQTGQTGRMSKGQLGERLKFVAEYLGLLYNPSSKKIGRTPVRDIKREHHKTRTEKIKTLFEQKKLQKIDNTLSQYFSENLQNLSIIEKIEYIINAYKKLQTQLKTLSNEKQKLEDIIKIKESNTYEIYDQISKPSI